MSIFSVDKDSAQVRFPPPLVFFGFLLIGWVINDWFGLNPAIPDIVRWVLGGGAIIAGLVVIALALLRFRRSGNNPEPWKTDTVFVAEGIYRVTRNPMYLGMALVFFGISVAANCLGGLLMLPLARQPTDVSDAALASIAAWRTESALANVRAPLRLDLVAGDWPVDHADAIFCANMAHIAPWEASVGLFAGAGRVLAEGALLAIYGPFIEEGREVAPSNLAFDANLRMRDSSWGLRDVAALDELALPNGLTRTDRIEMPANNLILVYRRT